MRKIKREPPVKYYKFKSTLEGPIFAYGKVGSGKSVSLLSIIQGFHDQYGFKIWDLFGGERNEGLFWSMPNNDFKYWNKLRKLGQPTEPIPKKYKVNYLYPYFEGKLPNRLPKEDGRVTSTVFTIPLMELDDDDPRVVIGNISETSKYAFREVQHILGNKGTSQNILDLFEQKDFKRMKNTLLYANFILPLCRAKLISDKYCDYNLDFVSEARNKDTITVLCLDFVPVKFHMFILQYIERRIIHYLDKNKIGNKHIVFVRESATFFRAENEATIPDNIKIFKSNMSHYIRMGRRGCYHVMDCQSSAETKGLVQGQDDYTLMFRTTSYKDKEEMTQELRRERKMLPKQIEELGSLEKGEAMISESGRNVKKIKILLPRTMYWKKEHGNFYSNVWNGEWVNTAVVKDYLKKKNGVKKIKKVEGGATIRKNPLLIEDINDFAEDMVAISTEEKEEPIEAPVEKPVATVKKPVSLGQLKPMEVLDGF